MSVPILFSESTSVTSSFESNDQPQGLFSLDPKQKLLLTLRVSSCVFCVISFVTHIYITITHTASSNGATVNINHIIHNTMCFIVLCKQTNHFNEDFILDLIEHERQKRVRNANRTIKIMVTLGVSSHILMLIGYYAIAGFDDFSALFYGVKLITIVENEIIHYSLITLAFIEITVSMVVILFYIIRYSTIHFALGIYVDQAHSYLKAVVQLGQNRFTDGMIFKQIEQSIQFYNSTIQKINDELCLIPLWLLILIFCTSVSGITIVVISNGGISLAFAFLSIGINLLEMTIMAVCITNFVTTTHGKMTKYRLDLISLLANSIKIIRNGRNERAHFYANRNSLKFTLITSQVFQSFVGNLYPLNYALLFSALGSIISVTVMFVTTLQSTNFSGSAL